jgi:hypothetical protein
MRDGYFVQNGSAIQSPMSTSSNTPVSTPLNQRALSQHHMKNGSRSGSKDWDNRGGRKKTTPSGTPTKSGSKSGGSRSRPGSKGGSPVLDGGDTSLSPKGGRKKTYSYPKSITVADIQRAVAKRICATAGGRQSKASTAVGSTTAGSTTLVGTSASGSTSVSASANTTGPYTNMSGGLSHTNTESDSEGREALSASNMSISSRSVVDDLSGDKRDTEMEKRLANLVALTLVLQPNTLGVNDNQSEISDAILPSATIPEPIHEEVLLTHRRERESERSGEYPNESPDESDGYPMNSPADSDGTEIITPRSNRSGSTTFTTTTAGNTAGNSTLNYKISETKLKFNFLI